MGYNNRYFQEFLWKVQDPARPYQHDGGTMGRDIQEDVLGQMESRRDTKSEYCELARRLAMGEWCIWDKISSICPECETGWGGRTKDTIGNQLISEPERTIHKTMEQEKETFRGYSKEQTCKQGVPERMDEPSERHSLGRLISDNYWSFLDGYQIYKYVVWVTPEDVYKYKEVNELGETLSRPSKENIVY